MPSKKNSYDGNAIEVLEGLDPVRKRPGMYIGSTDSRGLTHLAYEIFDNAVDEALAGVCTRIELVMHSDQSIEVIDNGRGIPVDIQEKTGVSALELVFTKLHAGGKFKSDSYAVSGGLHGVGAAVVNALSTKLVAQVQRDAKTYEMAFSYAVPGVFDAKGKFTPQAGARVIGKAPAAVTGSRVRYWADPEIFLADARVDIESLYERARQTAFLVPGLTITVIDQRDPAKETREEFSFTEGISAFVDFLAPDRPVCDTISITTTVPYQETIPVLEDGRMVTRDVERTMEVLIALRWGVGYDTNVRSFCNIVATPKGGTHVSGFERGLVRILNEQARGIKLLKDKDDPLIKDDVLEGLTAVVLVRLSEPQFEGQTKEILGTPAALSAVSSALVEHLRAWFANPKNKQQGRTIIQKVVQAARTRKEIRQRKETIRRKTALESSSMPAKLKDCHTTDERSELFILEGDSAMGCFTGETEIATTHGPVSFEHLADDWSRGVTHIGWAVDQTGQARRVALREPRITKVATALVRVSALGCEPVTCTPDHRFMLADLSYRRAERLSSDDTLLVSSDSGELVPASVSAVESVEGPAPVYDLTVDGLHNFILESGYVVHNSANAARNSEFQALLPIRGKILNVWRATEKKMLDNAECAAIITTMGAGSGKSFDIDAARYGKLILLADADVDGAHIRTLLLTLCYRYMRPLLEHGRVYAAVPPLHRIELAGVRNETARYIYTFTDDEMKQTIANLEAKGIKYKDNIQRYKGLGEMDADQLAETTMDPAHRRLRRISIEDAEAAERTFEVLMGDAVSLRRDFIVDNSDLIERDRLDI